MDKGTKIYAGTLAALCLLLIFAFMYEAPKVRQLNSQLKSIKEVSEFPYPFKVLSIEKGVATINSPIATELSCNKVVGVLFPSVKGQSMLSPEYQKASDMLAEVQTQIEISVKSDPQVHIIHWQLDRSWLTQKGIVFNDY